MAAKKRTNYAKCKVWGDGMTVEMEGTILGCMESMMFVAPQEFWQRYVDHLQGLGNKYNAKKIASEPPQSAEETHRVA